MGWTPITDTFCERNKDVVFVFLVFAFAIVNFLIHLRLGTENFSHYTISAKLWLTHGWPTMLLTRAIFENGTWPLWPILPAGIFTYGILWSPVLLYQPDEPRTTLFRLIGIFGLYVMGYILLGPRVYVFYA